MIFFKALLVLCLVVRFYNSASVSCNCSVGFYLWVRHFNTNAECQYSALLVLLDLKLTRYVRSHTNYNKMIIGGWWPA
jgi:hypothetical protein